jgi:glycosyltransferase involved in cell wall biosynthesis
MTMLIVTNIASFPRHWTATDGTTGTTEFARTSSEFMRFRADPSAIFLVNCATRLVMELALRQSVPFGKRRPLIALDMVFLRRPNTLGERLSVAAKRFVLRRVDYFIHYFKDVSGFDSLYGIGPERSGFVDFKANLWNARVDTASAGGEHVLCFGRSLRDFDTFFDAVEDLDYPAAIVDPQSAAVWDHGSRFTRPLSALPANVSVLQDDQTERAQANELNAARLVVVPMLRGRLVAAGISTILNAMILGKCVIATAGPGVTDVFTDQILSVPAEDAGALRRMIEKAWEDDELRLRTGQAGLEYARRCGSEQDFYGRVINAILKWSAELRS